MARRKCGKMLGIDRISSGFTPESVSGFLVKRSLNGRSSDVSPRDSKKTHQPGNPWSHG